MWFFAYASPSLVGRIVTQNLVGGLLLLAVAARLARHRSRRVPDRVVLGAVLAFGGALLVNVALAAVSTVPREITDDAELDAYLSTPLAWGLIIATALVLPTAMVAVLAATIIDLVEELRQQRDRDQLTGLLNRRGFIEQAEAALRRSPTSALILADLDFFKGVNDELGHAGGDRALVVFAEVLSLTRSDAQVAGLLGGEEFALLLPDHSTAEAADVAESIRRRVSSRPLSYGGSSTSVTASFGVATAEQPTSLATLLDAADRALYRAKALGRNCTAVDDPAGSGAAAPLE